MINLTMAKFNVKNPQTGEYEPLDGASQAGIQSDWNQTDNSAEDFIKNKPTIPTVPITTIQKNGTNIIPVDGTVNIIVPTTAADVSALPDTIKYATELSLTINSQTFVMTGQLKDQNGDNLGTAQTIDLPLESVVVNGSYNSQTKKVVLTLQNGNTIEFSVADLVSGLQTELSASNKLNPAYIDYDSTHRAVSDTEKSTWNGKQNAIDSSHKLSADLVDDTSATNKFATAEELEQIQTNKNNISIDEKYQGGVNLLEYNSLDTANANGCTYTINNDKSITINRTAASSATSYVIFKLDNTAIDVKSLCDGNHYLVGCPTGGFTTRYRMYATGGSYFVTDFGNGVLLNDASSISANINVVIRVESNYQADNLTFKPMIITKADYDAGYKGYQPYALPNTTITSALLKQVDEGAKNLLHIDNVLVFLANGVTFTANPDGTISTSGTATDIAYCTLTLGGTHETDQVYIDRFCDGNHILAGCPAGGNYANGYSMYAASGSYISVDEGNGTLLDSSVFTNICIVITIRKGTNANGLVFKPMICTAEDWAVSHKFVPYALPNTTITPALIKQVNGGAKNLVIDFGRIENNGCIFTYGSDGRITVTGTKSTALALADIISNKDLSNYGLSAGDKIVAVSDNENVGLEIIFVSDQGTPDPSIPVYNEIRTITIPSGRTKWYLRLQIKASIRGTINESTKPMVCDKKLYDIDPTVTPYVPTNRELYEVQADSMKLVYRNFPGEISRTVTYQMATTDFSNIGNARFCGMYLIMIVNWSTTPSVSIYSACYSGGTLEYHTLTKIGGEDAQLTIDENAVITYTGKGKIQIYALQ